MADIAIGMTSKNNGALSSVDDKAVSLWFFRGRLTLMAKQMLQPTTHILQNSGWN